MFFLDTSISNSAAIAALRLENEIESPTTIPSKLFYYIIVMDPLINRRIYDSDDENWKENRKKSLHDPINL